MDIDNDDEGGLFDMKIPYITIDWDKRTHRIEIGFGVYRFGLGCVFWCDRLKTLSDFWPLL